MNEIQIGKAARDPVSPLPNGSAGSSLPTHTLVTTSWVKPTNQASAESLVVPVFPATGLPKLLALAAVPRDATLCNKLVKIAVDSSDMSRSGVDTKLS